MSFSSRIPSRPASPSTTTPPARPSSTPPSTQPSLPGRARAGSAHESGAPSSHRRSSLSPSFAPRSASPSRLHAQRATEAAAAAAAASREAPPVYGAAVPSAYDRIPATPAFAPVKALLDSQPLMKDMFNQSVANNDFSNWPPEVGELMKTVAGALDPVPAYPQPAKSWGEMKPQLEHVIDATQTLTETLREKGAAAHQNDFTFALDDLKDKSKQLNDAIATMSPEERAGNADQLSGALAVWVAVTTELRDAVEDTKKSAESAAGASAAEPPNNYLVDAGLQIEMVAATAFSKRPPTTNLPPTT